MSEFPVQLRCLSVVDAPGLAAADAAAVEYPWSTAQFRDGLAAGEFGWCLKKGRDIDAFAIYSVLLDEATLLNIAVRPEARRYGYARALLVKGARECSLKGATRMLLEVRAGNEPAVALYRALGFSVDGVRRGYYPTRQGREDALLMSRSLPID